jgi:arginyl-tRNA synthetase
MIKLYVQAYFMKKDLIKILETSLNSLGILDCPSIEIEIPKEEAFGDASTPLAMGLSRLLKKAPKKIAEDLIKSIEKTDVFKKIDIAGPGFINFTFTDEYLQSSFGICFCLKKHF